MGNPLKPNSTVINKYNKLFDEVVKYYGLESQVMIFTSSYARQVHHINTSAKGSRIEPGTLAKEIKFLENRGYNFLVPFHIFSWAIINKKPDCISENNFKAMNKAITTIRSVKNASEQETD